nr:hypothetical protein [Tanacetum cinerariifolium]
MSTQQDIYAAGSENRPPMLNKENYVPWSSRLLRYAKSISNRKLIHNSIINGPYVRRMIPEPGDTNCEVPVNESFHEKKAKLFNEWERFTFNDGESIESYYHRFLKLMNDLRQNKHFPKKIASSLKFLNNLQPEWSRHVTIVHQTKDLHIADYTQLYDFLKYNQKEVDELKAKQLAKNQDPLALMATSNNPYNFPVPHQDQPSFNQNYLQQPILNLKDIINPTTAMNMALALMAKAFKLNYSTPTNNNQMISSNLRNRQIAQPGNLNGYNAVQNVRNQVAQNAIQNSRIQNVGNQNGLIVALGNANQNRNGNLLAARVEGNATGHNGNQIRCYNCRRVAAAALDEIEEVNANCILMANLQQASTSDTQTNKALVYDSDGSAEVHNYEDCYNNDIFNMFTQGKQYTELLEPIPESHQVPQNDNNVISEVTRVEQSGETVEQHPENVEETRALYDSLYQNLAMEVEKVNTINRKLKETNAELTTELVRFKNQEKCFEISQEKYDKLERCYQKSIYQEQCLSKKINALHLSFDKQIMTLNEEISDLNKHLSKEKSTVSFLLEEKKRLTSDFKIHEDKLLDKKIQLEKKIKELDNILVKMGQSIQTIHMLSPKPDSFYHTDQKMALEETLQLAQESRQKIKQLNKEIKPTNYTKINHLSGVFVSQTAKSLEELYFSNASKTANVSKPISIPNEEFSDDTTPSVASKFLNEEAAKFVGDFKSLAKEADESFAKHKALELEIERLLRAVVSAQKDNTRGTSTNTKFVKQSILGKPPMLGETLALSQPVTSNSIPTPQESKVVKNDKVIAPGMLRINPFKPSREEKHVPNNVRANARTKPITVSQPPVFTKKDVNSDSNGLSSTGIDNTKTRRPQPRSNTKNDRVPSASKINGKTSRGKKQKDKCFNQGKTKETTAIIIRTKNGTKFKNQVLKEYFDSVGISHQVSSVRTPQQNGVVEHRYQTLVEAARTMLIFSRAPLFLWAEAIATACFTQNRSIIHCRFNKTPYELINSKKPDISFLYVFGTLYYPKNDHEDIGKLGAKGDIGFSIGYSADSCAYRIYNQRTKKIMETMNMSFDDLLAMAFKQRSSKPELQSMTSGQISSRLDLTYAPSTITTQQPTEGELDLLFEAMYDDYIGGQPLAAQRTVPAAQAQQVRQAPTTSTSIAESAPTPTNSSSQATIFPTTSQDVDELNSQQHMFSNKEIRLISYVKLLLIMFQMICLMAIRLSILLQIHPQDYPLEQVIGEPSRPVLTRNQLRSDGDMCMYALTFKRLDVWVLVPAPDNISPLTLKWLFKNKHDEEQTVIQNKSRLVVRGYRQEEGIDFKESFARMEAIRIFLHMLHINRFIDVDHPSHVYKLKKALYVLKQAPKAWYDELSTFLLQNHFFKGTIDLTLFIRRFHDDILVSNYVFEILKKYAMESCDPIGTPMEIKDKFDVDQNGTPVDATKYRSMIDADYAGCKDTFKSTSGGDQFLGEKQVSWSSKKQDCTALSTAEAEYVHSHNLQPGSTLKNKTHRCLYHFIKEHVENGTIEMYFVKTDYQLADLFTKALPVDRFNYLVRRLGMRSLSPQELDRLAKSQ